MNYYKKKECRVCGNKKLKPYLKLKKVHLVNKFTKKKSKAKRYPLKVNFCPRCSLSQLSIVVEPSLMFENYSYFSGISKPFIKHCDTIVNSALKIIKKKKPKVLDIASNDGTLLKRFKKRNCEVLGIDPAVNVSAKANKDGIRTLTSYWGYRIIPFLLARYGRQDIITATNVFAHVDNVFEFLYSARVSLTENGIMIIEVPHILPYIENNEFDTTYHEHLSYFSFKSIIKLSESCNMDVFKVEQLESHGGSLRIYLCRNGSRKITKSVNKVLTLEKEKGLHTFNRYKEFNTAVMDCVRANKELLKQLHKDKKTIAAFAASAKGTILLNSIGKEIKYLNYIIDDTPDKQNKYIPNLNLKVVDMEHFKNNVPDYLLITAWNFKDTIMKKTKQKGMKYIIPIPKVRTVEEK